MTYLDFLQGNKHINCGELLSPIENNTKKFTILTNCMKDHVNRVKRVNFKTWFFKLFLGLSKSDVVVSITAF